ncbi:MAG: uroporphyrinogen decarboxylase family protein [Firmicutes bacterium]|nr:uroporphyrinogen decarboxylase family protein [Bacillota bacterium]
MTSCELVKKTIKGENPGRTPVYGWVGGNPGISGAITERFGSVAAFEDHYGFDMAHIFGGPEPYDMDAVAEIAASEGEVTPAALLELPLRPVSDMADYADARETLTHHKRRDRFCYIQTPGIFECLNVPFGIENHLCWLAMYPDELKEVYRRQAEWNIQFALNMAELGMDMIHVSDDWGAQNNLMFSFEMWKELIYPNHKRVVSAVKEKTGGMPVSLHSDGDINAVTDYLADIGYNAVHPWQESANMSYDTYMAKYSEKFAILGGLCIQTTLGFGDYTRLENEIRRVFALLKGKRWMFCTTHFVQDHCSVDELVFAYDLAVKLARE